MTKVWCPCAECENNENKRCTAKELNFKYRNMMTVNEGRVDMWVCNQYRLDEESQVIMGQIKEFMKEKGLS